MVSEQAKKLSASMEDYLEAIYNLSIQNRVARSKDIAEALGVSRASVTGALRILTKKELINYRPYGFATLTGSGRAVASAVVEKHNVIMSFFVDVLGVDKKVAQQAACKAEHALGIGIVNKLLCFTKYIEARRRQGDDTADKFKEFCDDSKKRNIIIDS